MTSIRTLYCGHTLSKTVPRSEFWLHARLIKRALNRHIQETDKIKIGRMIFRHAEVPFGDDWGIRMTAYQKVKG